MALLIHVAFEIDSVRAIDCGLLHAMTRPELSESQSSVVFNYGPTQPVGSGAAPGFEPRSHFGSSVFQAPTGYSTSLVAVKWSARRNDRDDFGADVLRLLSMMCLCWQSFAVLLLVVLRL